MKELKINMQHNPRNGTIEIGNFCSHYRIPVYDNSIDRLKNRAQHGPIPIDSTPHYSSSQKRRNRLRERFD